MSNRLLQIGRVPLIPDPDVAVKASQQFAISQTQTELVLDLGRAFGGLLSKTQNGVRTFLDLLERANQIQSLYTMSDKALADIGFRRDQLPRLFVERRSDDVAGKHSVQG